MRKLIFKIIFGISGITLLGGGLFYANQEKIIFFPEKTDSNHIYSYSSKFEEVYLTTSDDKKLHALYFHAENPKGVVYYLHGNSGNLEDWGDVAGIYLELNYDVFILDYRGFGKSEGKISNEKEFYADAELGYDYLKNKMDESKIVVIGYSIGTGVASYLASKNNPQQLILQSPYYSLTEVANSLYPFLPSSLLKYKFETHSYLDQIQQPISIFHGDDDKVIYYEDHSHLKNHLKPTDLYVTLEGQGHNAMNENPIYIQKLKELLK